MKKIVLVCFLVIIQTACATERGRSVNQVSASPASISLNYNHWYTGERSFANRAAENHCTQFNRHAELASQSTLGADRSSVTFDCVDP